MPKTKQPLAPETQPVTNFWQTLPKPFCVLAPMADVTDAAFRRLIAKYSGPDARPNGFKTGRVMWTEFVSADGLAHPVARERLKIDLLYIEEERPIVAQIFGSNPENIFSAAKYCAELGFDGIDINMGCPDRSIEKQGAGAAAMKNPENAVKVIQAAREGTRAAGRELPISVKTRLGYNKMEWKTWLPALLSQNLAALTVHLRTRKEMSKVPAHWDLMGEIVALCRDIAPDTLILGNGDVRSVAEASDLAHTYGCDGIMLGRAIFGNPWLFSKNQKEPNVQEKLTVMVEHTKLFEEILGGHKNFAIMKKHYKAYVNNFPGAAELRQKLFDEAHTAGDVEKIVEEYLLNNK